MIYLKNIIKTKESYKLRSLLDDLGVDCYDEVNKLLTELVTRTVQSAQTVTTNDDFADYRDSLNVEYADTIYRVIMRARRKKRNA